MPVPETLSHVARYSPKINKNDNDAKSIIPPGHIGATPLSRNPNVEPGYPAKDWPDELQGGAMQGGPSGAALCLDAFLVDGIRPHSKPLNLAKSIILHCNQGIDHPEGFLPSVSTPNLRSLSLLAKEWALAPGTVLRIHAVV